MQKQNPQTKEEARQYAIDWQYWLSGQNLSLGELADWQAHFEEIATKFDLTEEFKDNGII